VSTPPRPAELLRLVATRPRLRSRSSSGAGTITPAQKAFQRGEDDEALRIFGRGVLGEAPFERLPAVRKKQMRDNLGALRAQVLGAGFPPLGDDEVRGIRAPVLLVTGERSPTVFLRLTDRLEELLPTAERIEIPGASHGMHEENVAAVNEAIGRFLGRHRDRPVVPPVA
jgi:pimeloyl-ACP methyl ester carboxylesterase